MTIEEAMEIYPESIFVSFGFEEDGSVDTGVYNCQEEADLDEANGENRRMVARIKIQN